MNEATRQFTVLTRVKTLREDKALEALQAARRALSKAVDRHAALKAEAEASAASLPDRIQAVYAEVIGTVVDQDALGTVQQRAAGLESTHLTLVDRCDRAEHVVETKRQAVEAASSAYRLAQRNREKFGDLLDDMLRGAAEEEASRQEIEVEDLFSSPRRSSLSEVS